MSEAREALKCLTSDSLENNSRIEFRQDNLIRMNQSTLDDSKIIEEILIRDEPKPVLHENTMKQFGKCPVCNSSVAIQFHSDFCGKCGNRLIWRGEEK